MASDTPRRYTATHAILLGLLLGGAIGFAAGYFWSDVQVHRDPLGQLLLEEARGRAVIGHGLWGALVTAPIFAIWSLVRYAVRAHAERQKVRQSGNELNEQGERIVRAEESSPMYWTFRLFRARLRYGEVHLALSKERSFSDRFAARLVFPVAQDIQAIEAELACVHWTKAPGDEDWTSKDIHALRERFALQRTTRDTSVPIAFAIPRDAPASRVFARAPAGASIFELLAFARNAPRVDGAKGYWTWELRAGDGTPGDVSLWTFPVTIAAIPVQ
jgi:hypothetical protein